MPGRNNGKGGGSAAGLTTTYGSKGADALSGLGGSFKLVGGDGDDVYQIDDAADEVVEKRNQGNDTVESWISYTLPKNVENLILLGTDAISGTGNDGDNELSGNDSDNELSGGEGDDLIDGGAGDDTIDGGAGADTAVYVGQSVEFSVIEDGSDGWRVTRIATGETDLLTSIEALSFDDGVFTPSDLVSATPEAVARDDTAATNEDEGVLIDVLGNDDGWVSIVSVGGATLGTATITSDNLISYQPLPDIFGSDSLTYQIVNASGQTATATVQITIQEANDNPNALPDAAATVAGQAVLIHVLGNDTDVDGDVLSTASISAAENGVASIGADGRVSYTPNEGFSGTDTLTYTVTDGRGGMSTATASVTVASPDPDPDPEPDPEPEPDPAPETPPYYVTALLDDGSRMNAPEPYGTADTVTFMFLDEVPDYYSSSDAVRNGFQAFDDVQRDATRDALAATSDFANVTFVEVADASLADVTFGFTDMGSATALIKTPSPDGVGNQDNDIWLSANYGADAFLSGSDAYQSVQHELGHALGIDHPGTGLPVLENNRQHTVMSGGDPISIGYEPSSFMHFDIAALQYIYGANTTHRAGDDTYTFADFEQQLKSVWDAGGHDTFNFSAASYGVEIDLREGAFGAADPYGSNTFSVAYGTMIEDAIGGAFADQITGNGTANQLTGGAGADIFAFAAGWGDDIVTDFVRGEDQLDFGEAGYAFADLDISSSGGSTVVSDGANKVTLLGVAALDASDFTTA